MKLKLISILMLLSGFTMICNAQEKIGNISIDYGDEITEEKGKIVNIIGEANNKIYALGNKKKKYFLKVFSSDKMELLSNNEIKLPKVNNKKLEFEDLVLLGDKVYILGSYLDKKAKQFKLEAISVSVDGDLNPNPISLFSSPVAKGSAKGSYHFKISPNRKNLLAMHVGAYSKEDAIKYNLKLIDENLNITAKHSEKVSFVDKKRFEFDISDFSTNTNGDIFLVTNESYLSKKKNNTFTNIEVHVFKKANGYKKELVKIDLSGNEIINCSMIATHNNKLQLLGFYSELRKSGKANKKLEGVYNGTIDLNTNTALPFKFNKFDYETKVKLLGERKANKDKDLKPLYRVHTLIEKEDGGIIMLSEFTKVIVGKESNIGPISVSQVVYVNNEIIVTSLANDGSIEWTNVVAKEQKAAATIIGLSFGGGASNGTVTVSAGASIPLKALGKGPEYLGAIPIYKDGVLSIIFNDNKKNKGITSMDEIKPMVGYNKSVMTIIEFDKDGKLNRIDAEEANQNELIIRPQVYYDKFEDEYIIYSSKKSVDKLGRLFVD